MRAIVATACVTLVLLLPGCGSRPSITADDIQRDLVGKSTDEGVLSWSFEASEPLAVSILETKQSAKASTVVVDTRSESKAMPFIPAHKMAGRLRLHYEWIAGQWNLVRVENLTFKEQ